jgi:hypothetical protein
MIYQDASRRNLKVGEYTMKGEKKSRGFKLEGVLMNHVAAFLLVELSASELQVQREAIKT